MFLSNRARQCFCYLLSLSVLLLSSSVPAVFANNSTTLPYASRADQISDNDLKHFLTLSFEKHSFELDRYEAEVWLESMLSRMDIYNVEKSEALQILNAVYREAMESQLEPDLVLAVIAIESSFKRFAISSAGAQGLMQVMPFWKREIGRPNDNLTDIDTNIRYGCKILQYYLQRSEGRLSEALSRYNGSYGQTRYPEKVLVAWTQRWQSGKMANVEKQK